MGAAEKLDPDTLEQSFAEISPRSVELAAAFYHHLFALHPELFPLFARTNMAAQLDKLVAMLTLVVQNLRRPEVLAAEVSALGRRHLAYKVRIDHYPLVKAALVTTLAEMHGAGWTERRQIAWSDAYDFLEKLMLEAYEQ